MTMSLRKSILSAFNAFARSYYEADPTGKEFKRKAAKDYASGRAAGLRKYLPDSVQWQLEELTELAIAKLETATMRLGAPKYEEKDEEEVDAQFSFLDKITECYVDADGRPVVRAPGHLNLEQELRRLSYLEAQRDSLSAGLEKETKLVEDHRELWEADPEKTFNEIIGRKTSAAA